MNQLGSTDLYLGRPAVLLGGASRVEWQKVDNDSDVEPPHVPNPYIHYVNIIFQNNSAYDWVYSDPEL